MPHRVILFGVLFLVVTALFLYGLWVRSKPIACIAAVLLFLSFLLLGVVWAAPAAVVTT